MLRRLAVAWLVVLSATGSAFAQAETAKVVQRLTPPLGCDRLTIAEGLPNSNVTAIAQDARGFIWFGTQDGLARFDGTRMTVYRPNDKDPRSISSGYITSLALDSSGKLWVGTSEKGVNLYDPETDHFERIGQGTNGLTSEGVTAVVRDAKNRIWFAMSGGGLNRYDAATKSITAFVTKPLDVPITAISADRDGSLWLGTAGEEVLRWNPDDNSTVSFRPNADESSVTPVTAILAMSNGQVWIGTDGDGLFQLDPKTKQITRQRANPTDWRTISDDHIAVLLEDQQHTLWIGTANGLDHIGEAGRVLRYQHDPNDPDNPMNLAFASVASLFQDAGGIMWAGGFTVGVCKFDDLRMKFGHYRTNSYAKSFFQDPDGSLWVGTLNGLYRYDWAGERVTIYHSLGQPVGGQEPVSLESVWMVAMHKDRRGTLWISLGRMGLVGFDPNTDTYKVYRPNPDDPNSLPVDTVYDFAEDDLGFLWLATWGGGLVRFDPRSETFTSFTTNDSSGLSSNHMYLLYPDPKEKNILWIGTAKGGLDRFDLSNHTAKAFRHDDKDPASLSGDDVVALYREPSGVMWVGTYSTGLDRFDPQTGKAEVFTSSNSGLTNDTIYGILPDETGKLWLSTNGGGLLRFDPQTKQIIAYDSSEGIQDNEFSQGAFLRNSNGRLFFGGAGGFNAFYPRDIKRNPYVPPVVLTGFKRFNQDLALDKPIWTLPSIKLRYSDSFEVQFAALSFAAPKKNRYAYKLEGFDKNFIETDRPYATYTQLSGGHYTLRIRAANEHGVWNETGIALKLTITPPWWRSRPAYGAYLLLLALGIVVVARFQRARVMQAEREGRLAVVERDLALTGAVQTGFLPEENEISTPQFQLVGVYRPADSCGGDWWWHEQLPGGRHLVMVGDVTGHGPGPAMVTAAVATAFRVLVGGGVTDVTEMLTLLNQEVLRVAKGKYHMTMLAIELDENSGHWRLHSAGSPPLLSVGSQRRHRVHFCTGSPLGTESGFELGVAEGDLEPGDRLIAYTDGIPEVPLPNGDVLGMRKFAQHFERTRDQTLRDAAAAILWYADEARANQAQSDDWTFTLIQWG